MNTGSRDLAGEDAVPQPTPVKQIGVSKRRIPICRSALISAPDAAGKDARAESRRSDANGYQIWRLAQLRP
jgi:hypothetical protein